MVKVVTVSPRCDTEDGQESPGLLGYTSSVSFELDVNASVNRAKQSKQGRRVEKQG